MRRKDREITDSNRIDAIIRSCDCCRIGFPTGGAPYIVPLNFGYQVEGSTRTFYFHGAKAGRKIDLIGQGQEVGFELDTNHALVSTQGDACSYSFRFQSVIGTGRVSLVEDVQEKVLGLARIMEHYGPGQPHNITPQMADAVAVFKLVVREFSCKQHE